MKEQDKYGTSFYEIFCVFLDKITDDMLMEMTLEETVEVIHSLFLSSIPNFEYPRFRIGKYDPDTVTSDAVDSEGNPIVTGAFEDTLSRTEKEILAQLMLLEWLKRQLMTTKIIQMKYSTSDFKMTSQAAHMQRLDTIIKSERKRNFSLQRLYSRRAVDEDGYTVPNMEGIGGKSQKRYREIFTSLGVVKR